MIRLEGEPHQVRVQRDGDQEMTDDLRAERVDGDKFIDPPKVEREVRHEDHKCNAAEAEDECAFEALDNPRDLFKL